jgi:hypothetical protein
MPPHSNPVSVKINQLYRPYCGEVGAGVVVSVASGCVVGWETSKGNASYPIHGEGAGVGKAWVRFFSTPRFLHCVDNRIVKSNRNPNPNQIE